MTELQAVRNILVKTSNRPVNNYEILDHVLTNWEKDQIASSPGTINTTANEGSYVLAPKQK